MKIMHTNCPRGLIVLNCAVGRYVFTYLFRQNFLCSLCYNPQRAENIINRVKYCENIHTKLLVMLQKACNALPWPKKNTVGFVSKHSNTDIIREHTFYID
jgi:hypothetical protein